jgi:anti-sigma factor RsiW
MAPDTNRHVDQEELESYSMGRIPEEECVRLEEHLLVCDSCRKRLAETDLFIASMRLACARLRAGARPKKTPRHGRSSV